MRFRQSLKLLFLLMSPLAWANIAPDPISGGISLTSKVSTESSVIMQSEIVDIVVLSNQTAETKAVFYLKNDGEEIHLPIGFPHYYPDDFQSFEAWVDGQSAETRTEKVTHSSGNKKRETYWKVWDVEIPKLSEICIEVRYTSNLKKWHEWVTAEHFSPWFDEETERRIKERTERWDLSYVLTTGAFWKGTIGSGTIRIDLSNLDSPTVSEVYPEFATVSEDIVQWEMNDYEPGWNIEITFFPKGPFSKLDLLSELHSQHPDDWYITSSLASEYGFEKYRLYEQVVMSGLDLPQYREARPEGDKRYGERMKLVGNDVQVDTIMRMAISLVREYDRTNNFSGLRRICPTVLPMLTWFDETLKSDSETYLTKDRFLKDIQDVLPICKRYNK